MISDEGIQELETLAKAATFGREHWDNHDPATEEWKSNKLNNYQWCRKANPEAITFLVSRLRAAEAENAKLKQGAEILDKALAIHYCVNTESHRCTACQALREYREVVGE